MISSLLFTFYHDFKGHREVSSLLIQFLLAVTTTIIYVYLQCPPRWKKPALLKAPTDVVEDADVAVVTATTTTVTTVITTIMTTATTVDVTADVTRPLHEEDLVVR